MTDFDQRNQQVGTQYNADRISIHHHVTPLSLTDTERRRDRNRMLRKVLSRIESVLGKPLPGTSYMVLSLQEQPNAVAHPLKSLQQSSQSVHISGAHIVQIYEEAAGELLILGESGSGKTTLLQELAQELVKCALQDDTLPIPIIFNLSSWADKRQPLTSWLVEELYDWYQIPRALGQSWVDNNQVLPLLDGLDRVPQKHLTECIEAINAYRQEHGLAQTVVCSQPTAYLAQKRRLLLHKAVTIQPLTDQQVDDYLQRQIDRDVSHKSAFLMSLRAVIQKDPKLRELIATPLMLNILSLTYRGELIAGPRQVLASFVQQMLQDAETRIYTPQQTVRWLTWLAWQMEQHNLTEFYIERMQPDWLPGNPVYRSYRVITSLTAGLLVGMVFGIFSEVLLGPLYGLLYGLGAGLAAGLLGGVRREIQTVEIITWSWAEIWQALGNTRGIRRIVIGLVLGLVIFGSSRGPIVGLALGLLSGLLVGLGLWQNNRLIVGLAYKRLDKQNITVPNQGISRSLRYSVVVLVTVWLLSGAILGLLNGPVIGFLNGLLFGLISGLMSGGLAWIQHMILRLLLWKTKYAPLNYQRFLHYAAGCNLIYSVGGGYTFFHPQLQDYFTSRLKEDFPMLNPPPTLDAREKQGQDRSSPDKVTKQAQTTDPASYPASKRRRMRARRKSLPHPKV